jgi:nucleoside-diphosphate-sugar epimerase
VATAAAGRTCRRGLTFTLMCAVRIAGQVSRDLSRAGQRRADFAVTGPGFLGAAVPEPASAGSCAGLVRDPARLPRDLGDLEVFACDLPDVIDERAFEGGVGALVHCAFEMRFQDPERARRVNVEGSARLFEAARRRGVGRILFVTSMSARRRLGLRAP